MTNNENNFLETSSHKSKLTFDEDKCVCGELQRRGTVHRLDGPCYVNDTESQCCCEGLLRHPKAIHNSKSCFVTCSGNTDLQGGLGRAAGLPNFKEGEGSIMDVIQGKAERLPEAPQNDTSDWEAEFLKRWFIYDMIKDSPAGAEKEAILFIKDLIAEVEERGFKIGRDEIFQADREQKSYERGVKAGCAALLKELREKVAAMKINGFYAPYTDERYDQDGHNGAIEKVLELLSEGKETQI